MNDTTVLFRPVGDKELELIRKSDFTAWGMAALPQK